MSLVTRTALLARLSGTADPMVQVFSNGSEAQSLCVGSTCNAEVGKWTLSGGLSPSEIYHLVISPATYIPNGSSGVQEVMYFTQAYSTPGNACSSARVVTAMKRRLRTASASCHGCCWHSTQTMQHSLKLVQQSCYW